MRAIAIDDEPLALEVIRSHAEKVPFIFLDACFTDAFKAIAYLAQNPVDLLFLDIKMPDISGLELMAGLKNKPSVIFTTAYAEHAVESYELDAVDYLLKPFSFPRFLKACNKVVDLKSPGSAQASKAADSIFIKSGYEQVRIKYDDILYLESAGNYMNFNMSNGKQILSRLTMNETLTMLPANKFTRIHRSIVVNKEKVDRAERHQVHIGERVLPVGSAYGFM
ncbi:response regulator transcription factor [Mucilaginibacter pallidiroseus]|uniref:Response regulator transcription factor n=1 Tax=Mucilaginibacter pallidiroseus TaxID=2599295 RepID=A0A563UFL7_9SPHI|nr:response regulator transcription factor [Mucilaginibacter pallidiroseus]